MAVAVVVDVRFPHEATTRRRTERHLGAGIGQDCDEEEGSGSVCLDARDVRRVQAGQRRTLERP